MLDVTSLEVACPKCTTPFVPARSNQTYCSKHCQKNASRGPRTFAASAEERRRNEARSGRLRGLSDAFFETHPRYRAAFMVALIEEARSRAELRQWLTQRDLLRGWDHHSGTGRLHIAQCLDHFCAEVFGMRSFRALEKETELPPEEEAVFPALYYGPTADSVYEGGSLHRNPCPSFPWLPSARPRSPSAKAADYDWRRLAMAMNDYGWRLYVMKMSGDNAEPAFTMLPQEA